MLIRALMETLLPLPLLLTLVSPGQNSTASEQVSSLTVLGFKWSRTHKTVEPPDPGAMPSREMDVRRTVGSHSRLVPRTAPDF